MSMKQLNILLSVVTLIICSVFWKSAITIAEPADVYPKTLIIVIGLLAIVILIQALFFKKEDSNVYPFSGTKYNRVIMTIVATFIYYLAVKYIGFYVSSFIFMVILSLLLGKKEKRKDVKEVQRCILISFITIGIIFLAFTCFLHVPTPVGLLF